MSLLKELEFWDQIPVPERTRLAYLLSAGVRRMVKEPTVDLDLLRETSIIAADVNLSLWIPGEERAQIH